MIRLPSISANENNVYEMNSTEQTGWYDAKWYEWYNELPLEIQSNVNLPEFCDWEIQTREWFEWYNSSTPETQSRIKALDFRQWNEQTRLHLQMSKTVESTTKSNKNKRKTDSLFKH
jgi:hypothetical protein